MRLFFGLATPPRTAIAIADWRDRRFPADGRPVPVPNLHITLAFLGQVADERLDCVCAAAQRMSTGFSHRVGGFQKLLAAFHRARARHQHHGSAPDGHPVHRYLCVLRMKVATGQLERLEHRDRTFNTRERFPRQLLHARSVTNDADNRAPSSLRDVGLGLDLGLATE